MPDEIHEGQIPPEKESNPADAGEVPVAAREPEKSVVEKLQEGGSPAVLRATGPSGEEVRRATNSERRGMNRRELLKLVPVLALGAFAIPQLRDPLLNGGLHFSDWASEKLFSRKRLAQTFPDRDVVAFERFPYNFYDVADPGVDLDRWTADRGGTGAASGKVQAIRGAGISKGHAKYAARLRGRLGCDRKLRRHAGLRLPPIDWRRYQCAVSRGRMRGWILRVYRYGYDASSADPILLRNVWQAAGPRTWRTPAPANAHQDLATSKPSIWTPFA